MTTTTNVHRYFEQRVGQTVFSVDIAKDLGVDTRAIASAVAGLKRQGVDVGQGPTKGSYVYRGAGKTATTLFERIGETKDGRLVLQGEDGDIYLASKV